MAENNDSNRGIKRKPVPARSSPHPEPEPLPESWAADLTLQFRRTLSTKRMNALSSRSSSQRRSPRRVVVEPTPPQPSPARHPAQPPPLPARNAPQPPQPMQDVPPLPAPPPSTSLKNLPVVPTPPTDTRGRRTRAMMLSLSQTPCKWENPGLLDEALQIVPLQRIYDEAQEESDLFQAEAASLGPNTKPAWGYQDCVVRALLKWFRADFFEWINNPKCSACRTPTFNIGYAHPLPDELARGASKVELYQCANTHCQSLERFPRYSDAFVLLQTRRGRCGEWANCFSMLCRAMGGRVRWVWCAEDHVWTEVYSVHRKRWVHVDCCEGSWDAPLLYSRGWKKQISYCIAFSADGCADVTRRYVRDSSTAAPRNKCTEGELLHILQEINSLRRKDMDKKQRFALQAEDMKEDAEFRKYIIEALAYNIGRIAPGGDGEKKGAEGNGGNGNGRREAEAAKELEGRQSGNREWVRARGEDGTGQQSRSRSQQPPSHPPRDQRQQ